MRDFRKRWIALGVAAALLVPQKAGIVDVAAAAEEKAEAVTAGAFAGENTGAVTAGAEHAAKGPLAMPDNQPEADMDNYSSVVGAAYTTKNFAKLLEAGKFVCSDPSAVSMNKNEDAGGIIIKAKDTSALNNVRFTIAEEYDFGESGYPSRLKIDGLGQRKQEVSLKLYLDAEAEPLSVVTLRRQIQKDYWTTEGEVNRSIAKAKLTGKHKISMMVETTGAQSLMLRSLEFVKNDDCPVLYFDLEKEYSTIRDVNDSGNHSVECYGKVTVETPEGYTGEYTKETTKELTVETLELDYIRGRGNSTWSVDKKPYKFKLEQKKDFYGMGKNRHWVLLANRYDNSKLRNRITYWMGEQMGFAFTPRMVPVDVVMNGVYCGSYMLCEHVRVGSSRVNIDDLDETPEVTTEPAITGGYLLGMEPYTEEGEAAKHVFKTTRGNSYQIERPSFDEVYNESQYNYIKNYVQAAEDAVFGENFKDAGGKSWREYIDEDSAIKYYWMQEISMNGDAYISPSTYLYKPRNQKLFWGPLWDFDYVAWGDLQYGEMQMTEGFSYCTFDSFMGRLTYDEAFVKKMIDYYKNGNSTGKALSALLEEAAKDGGQLDIYKEQLKVADYYDKEKWGSYREGGETDFGEENENGGVIVERSLDEEVDSLKEWIRSRKKWVDENVDDLMTVKPAKVTFVDRGKTVYTQTIYIGRPMPSIVVPDPEEREGYYFVGWYTEDETSLFEMDVFERDTVMTAKWVSEDELVRAEKIHVPCSTIREYFSNGGTFIDYSLLPQNVTEYGVTLTSDNPEVATITPDTGSCVTFVKPGTANITLTADGGAKTVIRLEIIDDNAEEMEVDYGRFGIDRSKITVAPGESAAISIRWDGLVPPDERYEFTSLNPDVVDVDYCGVITGVSTGNAFVLVSDNRENKVLCQVTVSEKTGDDQKDEDQKNGQKTVYKKGKTIAIGGICYKITKMAGKKAGKLTVVGAKKNNLKKLVLSDAITLGGKKYTVCAIGQKAFFKQKKLKKIDLSATKHIKRIGAKAFGRIDKKAVFSVSSAKVKQFKKLLKKSVGFDRKKMKIYAIKKVRVS